MYGNVQNDLGCKTYNRAGALCTHWETPMTDVYVYHFMRSHGPAGEKSLSKRRATLATIEPMGGEPVMESQIVVDHTEVDGNGFLIGGVDYEFATRG